MDPTPLQQLPVQEVALVPDPVVQAPVQVEAQVELQVPVQAPVQVQAEAQVQDPPNYHTQPQKRLLVMQ